MATPCVGGAPTPDLEKLTRAQVAKRLRVSIGSVRRLEGSRLHPRKRAGVHYFELAEVEGLAMERAQNPKRIANSGELAAALFARFAEKQTLQRIVTDLRLPPRVVREHYAEWSTSLEEEQARLRRERSERVVTEQQRRALAANEERRRQELHEARVQAIQQRATKEALTTARRARETH